VKKQIIFLFLFGSFCVLFAQNRAAESRGESHTTHRLLLLLQRPFNVDSLKTMLATKRDDSDRALILFQIALNYIDINLDSSLNYIKQFNALPLKAGAMKANGLGLMADIYLRIGNPSKSLELLLQGLKMIEPTGDQAGVSMMCWNIGKVYESQNDDVKAVAYYSRALQTASAAGEQVPERLAMGFLGSLYLNKHKLDSALYFTQSAYQLTLSLADKIYLPSLLVQLGKIYQELCKSDTALVYYRMASREATRGNAYFDLAESYTGIAELLNKNKSGDSSYHYGYLAFTLARELNAPAVILRSSTFLKDFFKGSNRPDSAFKYQEIMMAAKDSLLSLEKVKRVQTISFEEQQRIQEVEAQRKEFQNRVKLYAFIASSVVFLFLVLILYRNNRQKQKANKLLDQKNEQIQNTLTELRSTQSQLIQQEKMASLGELTAGIAHEIQNPLNFVNNFSDVNKELIAEMKEEIDRGDIEEVKAIANDIEENEVKINHHGKRADAIVKGMLQHSRASAGKKELTDINALADEYVRLAFHGLRAKDKDFNATIETHFDESISKIEVVPQDIGRVLLNVYNNAFYAVSERRKVEGAGYEPKVSISTKRERDKVIITVADNGIGIPQKVIEKIFQPFFTTKPTGQGTGLGLSLSYDIIKAHNGEIRVKSKEGEGSIFIIELPL
jgi:signal transduction histidine kinase